VPGHPLRPDPDDPSFRQAVPAELYLQVTNTDPVTGPIDLEVVPGDTVATPVSHASVVQTPYRVDKIA
jgi:hypothetical protein